MQTYRDILQTGLGGLQKAVNLGIGAFQTLDPTAAAFKQAGSPEAQSGLLEQISHVPGAQVAADIPIGWKVLQGEGGKSIFDVRRKFQQEIKNLEQQFSSGNLSELQKEETLMKIMARERRLKEIEDITEKSKQSLEVTRTPEELAQMEKEEGLKDLSNRLGYGKKVEEFIGNKPLDEAAKKLLSEAREEAKKSIKTYRPEYLTESEKNLYKNFTQEEVENLILKKAKQSEETTKLLAELQGKRFAEKAAEEERLKNVVVPIEIEGGPLPKGKELPQKPDLNLKQFRDLKKFPESKIKELKNFINSELSELETRDEDALNQILNENLKQMGWDVDPDLLETLIKQKLKNKKD